MISQLKHLYPRPVPYRTDGITPEEYVDFLLRLFCRVSYRVDDSGKRAWRNLDEIKCMIRYQAEADEREEKARQAAADAERNGGRPGTGRQLSTNALEPTGKRLRVEEDSNSK